jgi:hypothetical protein
MNYRFDNITKHRSINNVRTVESLKLAGHILAHATYPCLSDDDPERLAMLERPSVVDIFRIFPRPRVYEKHPTSHYCELSTSSSFTPSQESFLSHRLSSLYKKASYLVTFTPPQETASVPCPAIRDFVARAQQLHLHLLRPLHHQIQHACRRSP